MPSMGFVESFNAAIEGFIYVMKTQRNMRIHFLAGVLLVLISIYLNFTKSEFIALCIAISMVLVGEMANTTVELLVDLISKEFDPAAKIIKDIAAGCVLVTSVNAVIVGYILFSSRLQIDLSEGLFRLKQSSWHVTFISLLVVMTLVIVGKIVFHKGLPLRGGMPSGHAAVAFAIWTIIAFLTSNTIVIVLTFVMALLIARHRIRDGIHSEWEVFIGAILGVLVTAMIFQLIK